MFEGAGSTPPVTLEASSAASSPSAAYAGLTLDGDKGVNMSGIDKGELSSTQVEQDVSQGSQSHSGSSQEENNTLYTHRPLARSASPAIKRPLADMEAGNSDSVHEDVEMVASSVGVGEREAPKDLDLTPAIQLNGESHRFDETKPNSIDMLQDESMDDESAESQLPIATNGTDGSFAPSPVPPIDEQVETIMKLAEKPFVNRQKLYLVSRKWLNRAVARSSHKDQVPNLDKAAAEGDIGPVDNSDIAAQGWFLAVRSNALRRLP